MENIIKILDKYGYVFVNGLGGTLLLSAVTIVCGVILGIFIALMRMGKIKPVRFIAGVYIEIIRGTPALLQLYFFWILVPRLIPSCTDAVAIAIGMVINAGAYISEIIRAGIQAVDKGQWEAARSLGMTEKHMMSRIIMPQAVKNILPALCNEFITTIKGTSLASVFFVNELMTSYKTVTAATFLSLESLTISGIIYLIINLTLSKLIKVLERRLQSNDR